ncbi:hypothetical protein Rhopal_006299-T1 [Rhodotorula paludigena]|uniref:Uncharacterized protein n=1 Tax=Rhodotorula paludigena TaxID=86838 RepID=A0AAV5GV81_9BASI|nr:hypothetical protein Rhopal_006299-T1 [Rhodotorula paludigena]
MAKPYEGEKPASSADTEGNIAYSVAVIDEHTSDEQLLEYNISPAEKKRLLRRLDSFIAPMVAILYLISFLDRSNLGNASTGGMLEDIGAPSNGLSVTTSIFYATYVTFEPFFTTILKTVKPSILLPTVVVIWGAIVLANGFIENYASLVAFRLVLGFLESALTPCLFLLLTFFYVRDELALRTSYMFAGLPQMFWLIGTLLIVSAATAGVVGGLIAAGLLKMDGTHGLEGWRWLYIVEGAITIGIGLISPIFIANSPQTAWYLSDRQKLLVKVRTVQSRQYNGNDAFSWAEVRKAFTEPMIWISGLMQIGFDTGAAIVYMACAYTADKFDMRFYLILPTAVVTCIGYAILIAVQHNTGVQLFACFLCATGVYTAVGLNVSWCTANTAGVRKRSTGIGIQQLVGNCGGIIAGQIYRSIDRPYYRLGHAVSLGAMIWAIFWMCVYVWLLRARNAKKLAMTDAEKEEQDKAGVTGDRHWSFMYVW